MDGTVLFSPYRNSAVISGSLKASVSPPIAGLTAKSLPKKAAASDSVSARKMTQVRFRIRKVPHQRRNAGIFSNRFPSSRSITMQAP